MSDVAEAIDNIMRAPRLRHVQSVLIATGGELVLERYFRARRADDLTNIHSVTKSVLSTLVGVAIDDGALSLATTIGDVLAERLRPQDADKAAITVEHLLTMTSGLAANGEHDIDEIADAGRSWIEGPLHAPLRRPPGLAFEYNNGAAHVLGVMTAIAVGTQLAAFAEERLFGPLGIGNYRWPTDPHGNHLGYAHLEVRPIDLLRLGELYRCGGRIDDHQVLASKYIKAATTAATTGGPPEREAYGFMWWVTERADAAAYFAGGFGGQYVTVVPTLELVVATTADVDVLIASSADPAALVEDIIIPAIRS
jgi:CubicO group peptidase (beta-lactamase class C family)